MTTPTPIKQQKRGGGLVGPLILISAGIILLLNNFGVIGWEIWDSLFRLWPIILIAVGLDIIIGRQSIWGSLVVAIVFLALVMGGLYYLGVGAPLSGQPVTSKKVEQSLNGATRAQVNLAAGLANLKLGAMTDANQLVVGTLALDNQQRVNPDFNVAGDTAVFSLREVSAGPSFFGDSIRREWNLSLTTAVPIQLDVKGGVGNSTLDLARLQLSGLNVNVGVGNTVVTLPERGKYSAKIDGGIGILTVNIPQNVAARIRTRTGIGMIDVGERYNKQGDFYVSANFDSADNRVELDLSGGIGNIRVQTLFSTP